MSNYIADSPAIHARFEHIQGYGIRTEEQPELRGSILFRDLLEPMPSFNARVEGLLSEIEHLRDDWNDEFGEMPDKSAIKSAKHLVWLLGISGQKAYHAAPGPNGEVMVDIRGKDKLKSLEIIFYPNKTKFVKFGGNQKPEQGIFDYNQLGHLIEWVNAI